MTQTSNSSRKVCLWGMNPAKIEKMEEEIIKWRKKDLAAIKRAMSKPEILHLLEKGQGPRPASSSIKDTSSNLYTITTIQDHLNHVNNNQSEIAKQLDHKSPSTPTTKFPPPETDDVLDIKPIVETIHLKEETDVDVEVVDPVVSVETVDSKHEILNVSEKDLSDLNSMLDPAFNEFVIQSGIFDETLDRFDDIPVGTSPLSLSFSSFGNSNSSTGLSTATPSASSILNEVKLELTAALKARQTQAV